MVVRNRLEENLSATLAGRRAILRPRPLITRSALVVSDFLMLLLAVALASRLSLYLNPAINMAALLKLWPALGAFSLAYLTVGLYSGNGISPVEEFKRLATVSTAVFFAILLALFLVGELTDKVQNLYFSAYAFTIVLLPLGRTLLRRCCADRSWWGTPVVVLGTGTMAKRVIRHLKDHPALGLKVMACLDEEIEEPQSLEGVPVLNLLGSEGLRQAHHVRHAIVVMPEHNSGQLAPLVRRHMAAFPHLTVVPNLIGMASLDLSVHDLGGMIGLQSRQNLLLPLNRWLKRGLDLTLLLPIIPIALPIILVAALWIKLVSAGSPFYGQLREGQGGKPLRLWKLRTMHHNASSLLEEHLQAYPEARVEWERFYKLKHDPRVLPLVGNILRRTSLDELPQLWNVLTGDMSLVGPRPFPYYHLEQFDEEFRALRCQVIPGITGMWQVSARSDGDLNVQQDLDSYYIRNWSLWLDLYLLACTPWAVLFGKGAY